MQVCTSLQTDNHASTPPLKFLQAGCPSCLPTNSVKALKANKYNHNYYIFIFIHQAGSNINNDNNNRKLNYEHVIKYYNLLQNWQKHSL